MDFPEQIYFWALRQLDPELRNPNLEIGTDASKNEMGRIYNPSQF